jgi:L-alanine-DL-glutamate epimerase-like enolase superfamily enzyme
MTIDRIELFLCRLPLVHFFETSFGRSYDRTFVLIRVEGEFEGARHEGWGESVAEANPYYSSEPPRPSGTSSPASSRRSSSASASRIRATCIRR